MRHFFQGSFALALVISMLGPDRGLAQNPSAAPGTPPYIVESPKIPPPPANPPAAAPPAKPGKGGGQAAPAGQPLLTFQADTAGYATTAEIEGVLLTIEGLKARIDAVERKLKDMEEMLKRVEVSTAAAAARAQRDGGKGAGSGDKDLKDIKQKLQELSNKYQGHSHDVMVEVRDRGGNVSSAPQGGLSGGQSATGRTTIGKPK